MVNCGLLLAMIVFVGDPSRTAALWGGMLLMVKILGVWAVAALTWARMRLHLAETGRRVNVNDLWIAATAATLELPVVTQDSDFDPLEGVSGLTVVRV